MTTKQKKILVTSLATLLVGAIVIALYVTNKEKDTTTSKTATVTQTVETKLTATETPTQTVEETILSTPVSKVTESAQEDDKNTVTPVLTSVPSVAITEVPELTSAITKTPTAVPTKEATVTKKATPKPTKKATPKPTKKVSTPTPTPKKSGFTLEELADSNTDNVDANIEASFPLWNQALLVAVNEYRASKGLSQLTYNYDMEEVIMYRIDLLMTYGFKMNPHCPLDAEGKVHLFSADYEPLGYGYIRCLSENIHSGDPEHSWIIDTIVNETVFSSWEDFRKKCAKAAAEYLVNAWANSPGHRECLEQEEATMFAAGFIGGGGYSFMQVACER